MCVGFSVCLHREGIEGIGNGQIDEIHCQSMTVSAFLRIATLVKLVQSLYSIVLWLFPCSIVRFVNSIIWKLEY